MQNLGNSRLDVEVSSKNNNFLLEDQALLAQRIIDWYKTPKPKNINKPKMDEKHHLNKPSPKNNSPKEKTQQAN